MKKVINNHPYAVTTAIFLVIFLIGMVYFRWEREELAFFLLIYLVAAIGIRLDEITQRLESVETVFENLLQAEKITRREMADLATAVNRVHGSVEAVLSGRNAPDRQPSGEPSQEMD